MRRLLAISFVLMVIALAGCASMTHPAAGTWSNSGMVQTTVVLNADGTGNYSLPIGGGHSIKWTEDGSTVKVFSSDVTDTSKATPIATGQLSDDRKTLNLNLTSPPLGLALHRKASDQDQ